MTRRPLLHLCLASSLAAALALAGGTSTLSCTGDLEPPPSSTSSGGGGPGGGGAGGAGGSMDGPYYDFPETPVIEAGLPANVGDLFDAATGEPTGGPCLSEPAIDAMVPRNWTPLLFEWTAPVEQNVFELRLKVDNQVNELVIYNAQPTFTIDGAMWTSLTEHSAGHDIDVTLRGATLMNGALTAGPFLGASGPVHIAPVAAPGAVVYWSSTSGTSFQGFTIGDPSPVTVLTPATAGPSLPDGNTTCVSCHASSPDGKLIIYSRDSDGSSTRAIDVRRVDGSGVPPPEEVSPAARALLGRHKQTAPVLSAAHYSPTDAVVISVFNDPAQTPNGYELIWTDLHAADASGWGILARNGDPRQVASPSWRHDGTAIAYVSSDTAGEGVVSTGNMDIYTIPYNNRAGGNATPLPGASDPAYGEFYPVYSPNDTLLAFNRHDQPVNSYNQPAAEVFVVPAAGGSPVRLAANDPPACTGLVSPGLTNSWARWAPTAEASGEQRYYWLVFSSRRRALSNDGMGALRPQLYISAIVTTAGAGGETIAKEYPALYVTSQDPNENNHTPAWDFFVVDEIPE